MRTRDKESGFSLIELLVAMSLFGGIMVAILSVLLTVQRDTVRVADRESAVTASRQAVAQIDRQVRSGNVLFAPGNELQGLPNGTVGCTSPGDPNLGNCMRIYTQSNGAERCVQWQVVPDPAAPGTSKLQTRSWSPTWSTDGIKSGWSVVSRGLSPAAAVKPFALQGGSTAYNSRLLDIRIQVLVPKTTKTQDVETSLHGRNTFYGYDPNTCNPVPSP